jgi:uncharacterized protein YbjT (DUF2867 family)
MGTPTILVTGAAGGRRQGVSAQGSTGFHVARLLLEREKPVRALVHRQDERSDDLRELGAEVVEGDLLDIRSVRSALAGVGRAYFTYPVQPGLLDATVTFAAAAHDAGLEQVVNLSQLLSRTTGGVQPTPHQNRHWLAEQVLDWADIGAVHLNAVAFYENLRAMVAGSLARAGAVALPWGPAGTSIPMISAQDVARVAAALLTGPRWPNGTVLALIGDIVTNQEIAHAFSEVLDRPIPYVELSDEQWLDGIAGAGINEVAIEHLLHLWRYLRTNGAGGHKVTRTIEDLGGATPLSLKQFVAQQRDLFEGAVQAAGS